MHNVCSYKAVILHWSYLCFTDTEAQEQLIRKLWRILIAEPHSYCVACINLPPNQEAENPFIHSCDNGGSFEDLVTVRLRDVLHQNFTKDEIITLSLSKIEQCILDYNRQQTTPEPSPSNNERSSSPIIPFSLTRQSTLTDAS